MQKKNNYDALYSRTLEECISIADKIAEQESERISLLMSMGKAINHLLADSPDKDESLRRLSRDIFIGHGKLIYPAKLAHCHQLYLNFESVSMIENSSQTILNGLSAESLLKKVSSRSKPATPTNSADKTVNLLRRAASLLERIDMAMKESPPAEQECKEVDWLIRSIEDKVRNIGCYRDYDGKRQLQLDYEWVEICCISGSQHV